MSLVSFDANDPSLNHVISVDAVIQNKAGLLGAYASGFLNDVFGVVSFVWPFVLGATALGVLSPRHAMHQWRWFGFFLLTLCLLLVGAACDFALGDMAGGGMLGSSLYKCSIYFLSPFGATLLWLFVFMIGLQLLANLSWLGLLQYCVSVGSQKIASPHDCTIWKTLASKLQCKRFSISFESIRNLLGNIRINRQPIPELLESPPVTAPKDVAIEHVDDGYPFTSAPSDDEAESVTKNLCESVPHEENIEPQRELTEPQQEVISANTPHEKEIPDFSPKISDENPFPSTDLLSAPKTSVVADPRKIASLGEALMACLQDFSVEGELVRTTPGPVVTLFEVRPARGTRVNRIANLADDLARALRASAIRIFAPVPNSDTVGIEIPNETREGVFFKELAASKIFEDGCGPLTMILGKDTAGAPFLADLTKMPHLLIAGASGQGKSVCLNGILISFLYRVHPDDLKLLLIDPKQVELAFYADEPHLIHPVVTDIDEAKNALVWAIQEMEKRYSLMKSLFTRDIGEYNTKLRSFAEKGTVPQDFVDLKPLPYLVIVIDELNDLMMAAGKDIENSIARLGQKARAAGIHMILATQRPSHDVVTGLIKINFPARIAFTVPTRPDSKTIIDEFGAEKLLGRGDMLFKSGGGKTKRLHGPFLSDNEVQQVVAHWKRQMRPSYQMNLAQWQSTQGESAGGGPGLGSGDDSLYNEVKDFVREQDNASISMIQRRFNIGFNRSARIVEQLEKDGIIGPANGSKPRSIMR